MELVVLWILFGVAGAALLSRYDKAGVGCLLGGLLGPIGLIIAWVMRDNAKIEEKTPTPESSTPGPSAGSQEDSRPRVKCPFCAELILTEARVCKHCGHEIDSSEG